MTAEGYCPFSWWWEVKTSDSALGPRIPLVRVAWIEGRVVDPEGAPLAGIHVRPRNEEHPFGDVDLESAEMEALHLPGFSSYEVPKPEGPTDALGQFLLAVVPTDSAYFVMAHHPDHGSGKAGPIVLESPSSRTWVEVVLERGATIRGRVIRNGEPWLGLGYVEWEDASGEVQGMTWTKEDGTYELLNVRAGDVGVFVRDFSTGESLQEASLVVEAGKVYEQDFAWEEELAEISGRVTTESGRPAGEIEVCAWIPRPGEGDETFEAESGEDGLYSLHVPPGRAYQVLAQRDLVRRVKPDVVPGSTDVDFVLPDVGGLRLKLVDAISGQPVRARRLLSLALAWRLSGTEDFRRIRAEVDADGIIELESSVGSIDLSIHLADEGYAPEMVLGIPVTESPDSDALIVELDRGVRAKIELRGEAGLGSEDLAGHLLFLLEDSQLASVSGPYPTHDSPQNQRINGLYMWLENPVLLNQMLRVDEMGFALVDGLEPGQYSIRSFPDDFAFEPESFEVTGQDEAAVVIRWKRR